MIKKMIHNFLEKKLAQKKHDVMKLRWEKERLKKELSQLKSASCDKQEEGDSYDKI